MAYCKKCGAYIPDGDTKCLACGYDEAAEREAKKNYSGGFAAEYSKEKEEMEQRRREREKERREYEAKRRARQEENRRWAQEERERRSREQRATPGRPVDFNNVYKTDGVMQHKILAMLSYFSILFILPMLLCQDDKFARYHAKQGLILFIFGIICDFLSATVSPFGGLLSLFRFYCMIKGISNASKGKTEPLPFIGRFMDR